VIGLILHQCDQRRNNQRKTGKEKRGKLVAQGLPAAGWHNRKHVLTAEDEIDDLTLRGTKIVEAKALSKNPARVHAL